MFSYFLYAYDGSGVPMSRLVNVVSFNNDRAVISFPGEKPHLDPYSGDKDLPSGDREVNASCLSLSGKFKLASFNFLD